MELKEVIFINDGKILMHKDADELRNENGQLVLMEEIHNDNN